MAQPQYAPGDAVLIAAVILSTPDDDNEYRVEIKPGDPLGNADLYVRAADVYPVSPTPTLPPITSVEQPGAGRW